MTDKLLIGRADGGGGVLRGGGPVTQILVARATIEQALEAMLNFPDDISDEMFESIRALRAALAQQPEPVQEPVATPWKAMYELAIEQRTKAKAQRDALLEALKELMEYAGIIEERCDTVATNKARAAIKKAEEGK